MEFLRSLFGSKDPTRSWPSASHQGMPDLDLNRPAFGSLVFGDPLEAASFFGRPGKCEITKYAIDLYYPQGFELSFEEDRFVMLHIYFHETQHMPAASQVRFNSGFVVSAATVPDDVSGRLGNEIDAEQWNEHGVMQYCYGNFVIEFIFDDDRKTMLNITAYLDH
jgi:hypothetical protein